MTEPAPLHRSAEVEDLTHLTEKDKRKIMEESEKGNNTLQRSQEMEDLTHLTSCDDKQTTTHVQKQ